MAQFRHKGNRLLSSYFLTYLAVLIIPIIMACIVFSESFRIIRQDIENENRSLLQQAADVLDVQMRQMNDYGAQLINNSSLTSLRSVENPWNTPTSSIASGCRPCCRIIPPITIICSIISCFSIAAGWC